eukprot:CAMPEP_0170558176 /NCGR_PEP_ID=MMETSP0211-20121228/33264_1 /TAXON_ID=311385 /ORGANISM="Pseudokeronopsis sp., Strain OXSARD2" /LENGTH=129 /DNA_ID=CAMNT_0010869865 /DNA_START=1891 /DNA_END=2280 /DNA_ORIENTATION=-
MGLLAVFFVVKRNGIEINFRELLLHILLIIVDFEMTLNAFMVDQPDIVGIDPTESIGYVNKILFFGVHQILRHRNLNDFSDCVPDDELLLDQVNVQIVLKVRREDEGQFSSLHDSNGNIEDFADLCPCH